jgi:hypothetical protein
VQLFDSSGRKWVSHAEHAKDLLIDALPIFFSGPADLDRLERARRLPTSLKL